MRNAASCKTANNTATPNACSQASPVRQRKLATSPTMEATPMTIVKAISVAEKWPVTTRAQPTRNSQIKTITANQKIRQGSATHFGYLPPAETLDDRNPQRQSLDFVAQRPMTHRPDDIKGNQDSQTTRRYHLRRLLHPRTNTRVRFRRFRIFFCPVKSPCVD